MTGIKPISLEARFWKKVDRSGDCWEWTASTTTNGYGRFRVRGGHIGAHVMAFELSNGSVPKGLEVHHVCENRSCVRPAHLRAVTHHENLLASDTLAGVNARKTHCIHGHAFDSLNTLTYDGKRVCRECKNARRRQPRAGNIGEPVKTVEFEPMPETVPFVEPAAPAVTPEPVPA